MPPSFDEIESLERTALEMVVQALTDYLSDAVTIFREEEDEPKDIAEDVTREAMDAMGVSGFRERLYGNVDFKKAMYVFTPEAHPIALMLDSKAEKANGDRTATIQMSQTSMRVMLRNSSTGQVLDEKGRLSETLTRDGRVLRVVTIIAKYAYSESAEGRALHHIIVTCIPNGALQDRYNPTPDDSIWRVGRNAPTLGEDFRVRLHYESLAAKALWRVKTISPDDDNH